MSPTSPISPMSRTSRPQRRDFSGLWIPLVTPFTKDGQVDHTALQKLVVYYASIGIAGLVVCGSTGEAAALDADEQLAVLHTIQTQAPGLALVMGVSGYHLGHTTDHIRTLGGTGICGILLPAPSYIRPSQAGLLVWFRQLADASAVPVLVYDIPYRTGSVLTRETLLALAEHPNIHGLKDCGGDAAKTAALIADGRLQVLAGEDAQILATVAQGGCGAIAAAAHLHTERFLEILRRVKVGEMAQAEALWQPLQPLICALFEEPNPGPLKALLAQRGLLANHLRSPMTEASAALVARLQQLDAAVPPVGA